MMISKLLKIAWILLRGLLMLFGIFVLKGMRFVAPDWTFRMIQKRTQGSVKPELASVMTTKKSVEDIGFLFSLDLPWNNTKIQLRNLWKDAQVGEAAPNPMVLNLEDKSFTPLLSFVKAGRPLVINFGSCT